jgi:hypothetical protein
MNRRSKTGCSSCQAKETSQSSHNRVSSTMSSSHLQEVVQLPQQCATGRINCPRTHDAPKDGRFSVSVGTEHAENAAERKSRCSEYQRSP